MIKVPDNIKDLGRFVCLAVLLFVTIGATVRLFSSSYPFEGFFTLLVCVNMWYLAVKAHHQNKE